MAAGRGDDINSVSESDRERFFFMKGGGNGFGCNESAADGCGSCSNPDPARPLSEEGWSVESWGG
jgi:hypothetical protein